MNAKLAETIMRNSAVDSLKGVGIIAVVAGHIYTEPFARLVFLWHMPLFFLISGYLTLFAPIEI